MTYSFNYLSDKILDAPFSQTPFAHILIEDFLSDEHFSLLTNSNQVKFDKFSNTPEAFDSLIAAGYELVRMPGAVKSIDEYLSSLSSGEWDVDPGKGVTERGVSLRLTKYTDQFVKELAWFLNGVEFHRAICTKFNVDPAGASTSSSVNKYLSGYEIPPHPDSIAKAITFLANMNTVCDSDQLHMHTRLHSFNDDKTFIREYWKGHPTVDRDWLPWQWCKTEKIHNKNNSILLFSPSYDTLHSVKCRFDHLQYQRTLIYGSTVYKNFDRVSAPIVPYAMFDIQPLSGDDAKQYRINSRI